MPFLCLYTAWWKGYIGIQRDCAVEKTWYFCPINQMTNEKWYEPLDWKFIAGIRHSVPDSIRSWI